MSTVEEMEFKDTAKAALYAAYAGSDDQDLDGEKMVLNMGPSHPATHGVLRLLL